MLTQYLAVAPDLPLWARIFAAALALLSLALLTFEIMRRKAGWVRS